MNKLVVMFVVMAVMSSLEAADVLTVARDRSPIIDGALEDDCWRRAKWQGDFKAKLSELDQEIRHATSFAVVTDRRNIYFGFRCDDANMASVRAAPLKSLWSMNQINLFLAPSGNAFDFYQFAFSATHGLRAAFAYSEGGNVQWEPEYLPDWEVKTQLGEHGWTAEVRLPITAFYHTRSEQWKNDWLVNVGRVRIAPDRTEKSSWSPVQSSFPEADKLRAMTGFPDRHWRDDTALTDVQFVPTGIERGRIAGFVSAKLYLKARGKFTLTTSASAEPLVFNRLSGTEMVRIPATFEKNGTYPITLKLVRADLKTGEVWGNVYQRDEKVRVDFKPIDVRFTHPAYRANFYPGQDYAQVAGTVAVAAAGAVKVEIVGPGIPHQELTLEGANREPVPFTLATPNFAEGEAVVTVTAGGEKREFRVRRLAKNGRRMSWVENGNLIVDGQPVLSRRIAHPGYMGGEWLDSIFKTNEMHETKIVNERGIEFERLMPGSEAREGTKDQMPSPEVLAAMAKHIEKMRDTDFTFWYICDEPECRAISPVYLKHLYDFVAAKDPYHVIRIGTRSPKRYLDCCDWFETHPYIDPQNLPDGRRVYGRPLNTVGDFVSEIADLKRPDKVIGFYTSAFSYTFNNPNSDYPTFAEYMTHSWAGMIRGARSVIPYAYHDIGDRPSVLEGTRLLFHQLEVLAPFLLANQRTVLKRTSEKEIVRYTLGADTLTVTVDFKALQVTLDVTGDYAAKLPSCTETAALVERLGKERTQRGNLLYGKWRQLDFDGSLVGKKKGKPSRKLYKLVDGTLNVIGALLRYGQPNWLEIGFNECQFDFSQVTIWGNMKSARLLLKVAGEWQPPIPGVRESDWNFRFALPNSVRAEAIKFEFNGGEVQVYEVEVKHL